MFNFPFEQHINSLRKLYLTLVYETDPQALPLKMNILLML